MAGDNDAYILREYLVSLGFKVDAAAQEKFGGRIQKMDIAATKLGRSLVGVAVSAQAMVTEFAFRMERLYYASRLAQSSAANLQALDFAGKQAGIKDFQGNILSLARSIRANPGIQGLINSLGVKVTGRDMADVTLDLVKALSKMPPFLRQQYGALFGWSPDDIQLMVEGYDKILANQALQKQVMSDLGVDMKAANEAGLEYARSWREILMYADGFAMKLSVVMLPAMQSLAGVAKEVLSDWTRLIDKTDTARTGITAKGAAQSGLTVDEQREMAKRLEQSGQTKTWSELTPSERRARGLSVTNPSWSELTPAERKARGWPETEADLPYMFSLEYGGKVPTKTGNALARAAQTLGITSSGSAELSSSAKERIGQDRLRSSIPRDQQGWLGQSWEWLLDKTGYRSRSKEAFDPRAVDAVTEPAVRAPDVVGPVPSGVSIEPPAPKDARDFVSQQEKQKRLPSGLLDYIWGKESGRSMGGEDHPIYGPPTKSGEVAQGPFQFMSGTAMKYGVGDTQDFKQSAQGAAQYLSDLMKRYGDARFAAAAYNWGEGNLDKLMTRTMEQHGDWSQSDIDKYVLGHLPAETRKYIAGLGENGPTGMQPDVTINADTKINVYETGSAKDTAQLIAENQRRVNADIARQFSDKLR